MDWLALALIGAGVLIASWMLLVLLAARLPEGSLKELAAFLPDCATAARRLRGDSRVPTRAKVAVGFALLWVLSPIDLIPEFLRVIGPLDDVVVVALAFRYAARQVPRQVLLEAWPGKPSTIERLLGPDRSNGDETGNEALYEPVKSAIGDEHPAGLVVHMVLKTSDGLRHIEVWDSIEEQEQFHRDRVEPAVHTVLQSIGLTDAPPPRGHEVLDLVDLQLAP